MQKVTTYSFLLLSYRFVTHHVYLTIQIRKSTLSDNTSSASPAICKMATVQDKSEVRRQLGPEKVYIVYAGPMHSIRRQASVGSLHGSFIVSWENKSIPSIICVVAHPGSLPHTGTSSSHNLAAAWAVAVILGVVQ